MKSRSKAAAAFGRREFVRQAGLGVLASALISQGLSSAERETRVAFCSANLVARFRGYRFESLDKWTEMLNETVAKTDSAEWQAICQEIAAAGFRAIEVWEAHASPEKLTNLRVALEWKKIMDGEGLKPVGYAGRICRQSAQICQWLGISRINHGFPDQGPDEIARLCEEFGIHFNLENHYQKSVAEILEPIGGGNKWLGVCVDTGWLGTQGLSGPGIIKECGALVRHTHIKDVAEAGGHATCLLGKGVVDPAACIQALKDIGYSGWYSWEDEPEDRNPMDSAERNRLWIEKYLKV